MQNFEIKSYRQIHFTNLISFQKHEKFGEKTHHKIGSFFKKKMPFYFYELDNAVYEPPKKNKEKGGDTKLPNQHLNAGNWFPMEPIQKKYQNIP